MILYYVRHGDPIYVPDSLTPLGHRQAEAVAKRLAAHGIDKVFASTSNRAMLTAKPTCELTKNELIPLEFAHEDLAWRDFTTDRSGHTTWLFHDPEVQALFADESVLSLGNNWCTHPEFTQYQKGLDRVFNDTYEFFKSLGYEHIRGTGKYKVINHNEDRVALFAHQGFGLAFLSTVLDIPYPIVANHFDMCHTGVTAIKFDDNGGYSIPKVMMVSSDAHIYADGLPTKYNNETYL